MRAETPYIMKLNAQQRFERLNLYGLVQGLSYVVRLNDLKTAQHLRARLALVLRHPGGLAKPLHAELKELFAVSGVWIRNVGDRHQTRRNIQGIIRRIIPRLKRPLARRKLERGAAKIKIDDRLHKNIPWGSRRSRDL